MFTRIFTGIMSLLLVAATSTAAELSLSIGKDQHSQNTFSGAIGRFSFYETLTAAEIETLAKTAPDAPSPFATKALALEPATTPSTPATKNLANAKGHPLGATNTLRIPPSPPNVAPLNRIGAAEAWLWLDATNTGNARIFDRITPGGTDGWLLDLFPGRNLRAINRDLTTHSRASLPVKKWVHVAVILEKDLPPVIYLNGKPIPPASPGNAHPATRERVSSDSTPPANTAETVWCEKPAADWFAAFPIGNGRLGAMVHGGVATELLTLNEDTLWSGEPRDYQRPGTHKELPEIRQLLYKGNNAAAQKKIDSTLLGPNNESYMPLGNLTLRIPQEKTKNTPASTDNPATPEITHYRRELDLREGIAKSSYALDGTRYERECFASYPDQVIVYQIKSDKNEKIALDISLSTQLKHEVLNDVSDSKQFSANTSKSIGKKEKHRITIVGNTPAHVDAYAAKNVPEYKDNKGMRFAQTIQVEAPGGTIEKFPGGILKIRNATVVRVYFTAANTYKDPWTIPAASGEEINKLVARNLALLEKVSEKNYVQLRAAHVTDYQTFHNRVQLDIPATSAASLPMEKRLAEYTSKTDPQFAALYYQFGRHLLISSSRPGTQPANLQGVWNRDIKPPWSANWTLNCNVQINYWPVETANLGELHEPLVRLTKELAVDGTKTAKNLYNARGWVAHHNADIWRTTWPVGGTGLWAIYQVGGAWLCQSIYEHYLFSGDKQFLEEIYPILQGASLFYFDTLQPDPYGYLTTNPATSFENTYRRPDGVRGWATCGAIQDIQIVRALLRNTLSAAQILNKDPAFQDELAKTLRRLPPNKISPTRSDLQEWVEDWTAATPHNGQLAHGWALNPDWEISPVTTPALAAAFRKTLELRRPWMAENCASWVGSMSAGNWARLGEGGNVEMVLQHHVKRSVNPSLFSTFNQGRKSLQNDGNLGITAAIGETLLQSRPTYSGDDLAAGKNVAASGEIPVELHLLPALLPSWPAGRVSGLRARGGFTVGLQWTPQTVETTIRSTWGTRCRVRLGNRVEELEIPRGGVKVLKWSR